MNVSKKQKTSHKKKTPANSYTLQKRTRSKSTLTQYAPNAKKNAQKTPRASYRRRWDSFGGVNRSIGTNITMAPPASHEAWPSRLVRAWLVCCTPAVICFFACYTARRFAPSAHANTIHSCSCFYRSSSGSFLRSRYTTVDMLWCVMLRCAFAAKQNTLCVVREVMRKRDQFRPPSLPPSKKKPLRRFRQTTTDSFIAPQNLFFFKRLQRRKPHRLLSWTWARVQCRREKGTYMACDIVCCDTSFVVSAVRWLVLI